MTSDDTVRFWTAIRDLDQRFKCETPTHVEELPPQTVDSIRAQLGRHLKSREAIGGDFVIRHEVLTPVGASVARRIPKGSIRCRPLRMIQPLRFVVRTIERDPRADSITDCRWWRQSRAYSP